MTATLRPVQASIVNPQDWDALARQFEAHAGVPTAVTPELMSETIGGALALLFEADASGSVDLLRGTFADPVVAQCARNVGYLGGARPIAATVKLVGTPIVAGQPVIRVHVCADVEDAAAARSVSQQFWDLQFGAQVIVGHSECPNCGAPVIGGALICGHCGTDVRSVAEVPIVVSRLELY